MPIDPSGTQLYMSKSTTTTVAAQGDFVQYSLAVENTSAGAVVPDVEVTDTLPSGMRYRAGSARINGGTSADPTITADGRTLTFRIGTLSESARAIVSYVAEITATARGERLTNSARAANVAGAASNTAQATIRLRNELFSDQGFITGRVAEGACGAALGQRKGVAGVRVYLEDGRYAVTDDDGKYHFEGIAPGSHVVQLDTVTLPQALEALECGTNVRQAGRAYSQFADLRRGALWRSDFLLFRKPLPKGSVTLQFTSNVASPSHLSHTIVVNAQRIDVTNTIIHAVIPEGLKYQAGSASFDGRQVADPASNGDVLTFRVGAIAADTPATLTFRTNATPGAATGMTLKAVATFDTPSQTAQRTSPIENVAMRGELLYESASYRFSPRFNVLDTAIQAGDRAQLDKIVAEWRGVTRLRLTAIGHSDQTLIASRSRPLYPDNYALSRARAQAVANYLMEGLDIEPSRVNVEGRGADEPLSANHDPASLALNRRVEISIEGLRVVSTGGLALRTASAQSAAVETVGTLESVGSTRQTAPARSARVDKPDVDVERLAPASAGSRPPWTTSPRSQASRSSFSTLPSRKSSCA